MYTPHDLQQKGSTYLFRKVVKGMLPKNKLSDRLLNNMYVYDGPEHKHEAQKPRLVDLNEIMQLSSLDRSNGTNQCIRS